MEKQYYVIRTDNTDELYHHGVKGMKWGVRRYRNEDGSLTALGRDHAKALNKDGFDKVRDKDDLKISSGSSLYRISTNKDDTNDTRYLSYRPNDRNFYKGYWGRQLRSNKPDAELYEQTYKAKHDILIPSAKTRRTILSDLLKDDNVIKSICKDTPGLEDNLRFSVRTWSRSKQANYLSKWMGHRPDILAKYGEQVVSRGFNAVIDDNGRTVGEMPIIMFTANNSLNKQKVEKVDRFIEECSQRLYSESEANRYRTKTASI